MDKNGHVDHREFMLRLGAEFAPGDVQGTSTKIAEENFMTIQNFRTGQRVRANCKHQNRPCALCSVFSHQVRIV